jgi:hypothetical protein
MRRFRESGEARGQGYVHPTGTHVQWPWQTPAQQSESDEHGSALGWSGGRQQLWLMHENEPPQHSASLLHCPPVGRQHVPLTHVPLQHDAAPK